MFEMRVSNVINNVVGDVLPTLRRVRDRKWDDNHNIIDVGMAFRLDLSMSVSKGDNLGWCSPVNVEIRHMVHMLFCGHVSVFGAVEKGDERFISWQDIPLTRWENTSNHDSCWRSDGVDNYLTKIYFEWADAINEAVVANGGKAIPPASMHQFCTFGLGRTYETVLIAHQASNVSDSYWREVVEVERYDLP